MSTAKKILKLIGQRDSAVAKLRAALVDIDDLRDELVNARELEHRANVRVAQLAGAVVPTVGSCPEGTITAAIRRAVQHVGAPDAARIVHEDHARLSTLAGRVDEG